MSMKQADKEKAAFFAEIATIAEQADERGIGTSLTPGQRLVLQERAEALFGFKSQLDTLLARVRKWLLFPLQGKLGAIEVSLGLRLHNGEPEIAPKITNPSEIFLADLWRLILLRPFPFKHCPVCQRIFATQSKKKRYCSANCSYRGIEEARKEKRRPEARERMRRLRKQQKEAAMVTQKAIARRHRGEPPVGSEEEAQLHATLSPLPIETDTQRKARQQKVQKQLHEQYQLRKSKE